jgi:hypothetical protein
MLVELWPKAIIEMTKRERERERECWMVTFFCILATSGTTPYSHESEGNIIKTQTPGEWK